MQDKTRSRPFSFQKLVADLSSGFVFSSLEETDTAVRQALALCVAYFQAQRGCVFLFFDPRHTMRNSHEYCVAGVGPGFAAGLELPLSAFPWLSQRILMQELVYVPDPESLPPEAAAERAEFAGLGIQSLVCLPLVNAGRTLGFFGLETGLRRAAWNDDQLGMLAVLADILAGALARRQAERQLERSRNMLENAQRIAGLGNWEWDIADNSLIWSAEVYRIFGIATREFAVSYELFLERVHPDDLVEVQQAVDNILAGDLPYDLEHRILRPDGSLRWVHERAEINRDAAGRPLRMLGTVHDITERKALEAQIIQARKMEALGVLAGGIAHDFNNILTPIIIHTQMALMETPADAPILHNLEQVHRAAENARGLVRQILDFSRQGQYAPHPLKLGPVIREAIRFLRPTLAENIRVSSRMLTKKDLVRADSAQLLQVIMNLLLNAAQAMRDQGGTIAITLRSAAESLGDDEAHPDVDFLQMTVTDTGVGIAPEILPRIFEPYFTTKGMGTGMGLAVVHGLVKKHGGKISVYSRLGNGATFTVLLPVA